MGQPFVDDSILPMLLRGLTCRRSWVIKSAPARKAACEPLWRR